MSTIWHSNMSNKNSSWPDGGSGRNTATFSYDISEYYFDGKNLCKYQAEYYYRKQSTSACETATGIYLYTGLATCTLQSTAGWKLIKSGGITRTDVSSNYGTLSTFKNWNSNKYNIVHNLIGKNFTYSKYPIFVPDPVEGIYNAKNGVDYYYKGIFEYGTISSNTVDINITFSYGKSNTNYDKIWYKETKTFNSNNQSESQTILNDLIQSEIDTLKNYLDTIIEDITVVNQINRDITSDNGFSYSVKVMFSEESHTETESKVSIVSKFNRIGKDEIEYKQLEFTITAENYKDHNIYLAEQAISLMDETIEYLNTRIEEVTLLEDRIVPYLTKSNMMLYIESRYTAMENDDTHYDVNIETYWGFRESNISIPFSNVTHSIVAKNYAKYPGDLDAIAENERNRCISEQFKIWDIELPIYDSEKFINKGARVWYIRAIFKQGETNDSTNNIHITTYYGSFASVTEYSEAYETFTYTVTESNVDVALEKMNTKARQMLNDLKAFLDIPSITAPAETSITHFINGFNYTLSVTHSKDEEEINVIHSQPYIDGLVFEPETISTFYTNQSDADSELYIKTTQMIQRMREYCNENTVPNTSIVYPIDNINYLLETRYSKKAGSDKVDIKTYIDGYVYQEETKEMNVLVLGEEIEACSYLGNKDLTELKDVLNNITPRDRNEKITIEGLEYSINCIYTKTDNDINMKYRIMCDGIQFVSGEKTIFAPSIRSDIDTFNNEVENKLIILRNTLDNASPKINEEVYTVNGLKYLIRTKYMKPADSIICTLSVSLDGSVYKSSTNEFKYTTIDMNKNEIYNTVQMYIDKLKAILDKTPSYQSYIYTHNNFNYIIQKGFTKDQTSNILTTIVYIDNDISVSRNDVISFDNFDQVFETSESWMNEMIKNIELALDLSPEDEDYIYTVDGFDYNIQVQYKKDAGIKNTNVAIILDKKENEVYAKEILANNIRQDILELIEEVITKTTELKNGLKGILPDIETYIVNGFEFDIEVRYIKDLENNELVYKIFLDDKQYGDTGRELFNPNRFEYYKELASQRVALLKEVLNKLPASEEEIYFIYGFGFKVGVSFYKGANTNEYSIYQIVDEQIIEQLTETFEFNIGTMNTIKENKTYALSNIKNVLKQVPMDYNNVYKVGSMGFLIGMKFIKDPNISEIYIQPMIDGDIYGERETIIFDANNIGMLKNLSDQKLEGVKRILDNMPSDNVEEYQIRNFRYDLESYFVKLPGEKEINVSVKVDNRLYDKVYSEIFDRYDFSNLINRNDELIKKLKGKLVTITPMDLHTTYNKNGVTFAIDIYFSKAPGTDKIKAEFNVDDATLATTEGSMNYHF